MTARKSTAAKKTTTKKTYTQEELDQILADRLGQSTVKPPEIVAIHGFCILEDSQVVPFARYNATGLVINILTNEEYAAAQAASSSEETLQ